MKIAILGTRGIPNNYGGFEQFAENISQEFAKNGHEAFVYNPKSHPFKSIKYKNVNIIRKFHPEKTIGASANIIYDFLCLKDAKRKKFDIILECGYGSAAFSFLLVNTKRCNIITNMDGMEWHRTKWSNFTKGIIQRAEKIAVKKSKKIVADNICIKDYFRSRYRVHAHFIPYGASINNKYDVKILEKYNLKQNSYHLIIARIEPENNIEAIIKGIQNSKLNDNILIIGNINTKHGKYICNKYNTDNIIYKESIFDFNELNSLRHFSKAYFHGHSIGGTNPSLLESMASECFIFSHNNIYNKSVLDENAIYFKNSKELANQLNNFDNLIKQKKTYTEKNLSKIEEKYSWSLIAQEYEDLFKKIL